MSVTVVVVHKRLYLTRQRFLRREVVDEEVEVDCRRFCGVGGARE